MDSLIQLKKSAPLFVIALLLTCFALSPRAQAVVPPPDGGYPNANTAEGTDALFSLTIGSNNTAIGFNALFSNTNGTSNTAVGSNALLFNISGQQNVAIGESALINNLRGSFNTATGVGALFLNDEGRNNTAIGFQALVSNTIGINNTANGVHALMNNVAGINNTATGFQALLNNGFGGNGNTGNGANALLMNFSGTRNTANGVNALQSNTIGNNNVAEGVFALSDNTSGSSNIALGFNAGSNLTTGSNNIDIGASGVVGESNTIRIGRPGLQNSTFIAGIFGVPMNGSVVVVNSSGKLGVTTSSARFKDDIKPMGKASEMILQLKPVTFRYKEQIDPDRIPQFGLIAEEVEKLNPELVVRDADGKINTVRYEAVNAMLLNEFLKEHRKVEQQEATITQLKSTVAQQQKDFQATAARQQEQIEALTAGLQNVSDQIERSSPQRAPQMALNNE